MGRHRWLPASGRDGTGSGLKRAPRFRIALGAAFVVAGLCLGYGIVSIATADLSRSATPVVDGIPLRSGPSSDTVEGGGEGGGEGSGEGGGDSPAGNDGEGPAMPTGGGTGTNGYGGAGADAHGDTDSSTDGDAGAPIIVHVAGAVASPGIVRLGAGARVFEAIEAAGGARKEAQLEALNLAAPLTDGQQVYVPTPDDAGPPPATGSGSAGGGTAGDPAGKININTASAEELAELPRVGPVLAGRIVEFREQHGPYGQPSDLDAVPGIGPVMLEALVELVTV